jgi:predicted  nucleic acid-binding Zn-ribbon protein
MLMRIVTQRLREEEQQTNKDLETVLVGKPDAESQLVTERNTCEDLVKKVDALERALADADRPGGEN